MRPLEYPYRFKGRHAFVLTSIFLGGLAVLLLFPAAGEAAGESMLRDAFSSRGSVFILLIPVMVIATPFAWFLSRHQTLRLTDSELRVGKAALPLAEVQRIKMHDQRFTRAMIVEAGAQKVAINQMMLPSPKAFDEVYKALTSNLRS